ncbi:IS2 repressor TnpA [compost metagenome]
MSNTNANFEMTGILLGQEVRKRKTPQEKIAIIQQTMEPGMHVSHVARLHGICSSGKSNIRKAASQPLRPERKSFLLLSLLLF